MTLAQYVTRVMDEKGLSAYEVERKSGYTIADSYVTRIKDGKSKRPSVQKLYALSIGLGVDFGQLVAIASGLPASGKMRDEWTPESLAAAINDMVKDEKVGAAVRKLLRRRAR